jgi:hypothetical protein
MLILPFAANMCNNSEHSATGHTPFNLFGHPCSLPSGLKSEPYPPYDYNDYVSELKGRLYTAHHVANRNRIAIKVRSKDYYDKGTEVLDLIVGDKVLTYHDTLRRSRSRNLNSQWILTYDVI